MSGAFVVRVLLALIFAASSFTAAHAEQSLGDKIKRALNPTPTPSPHHGKKKKPVAADEAEKKSTPEPSASPTKRKQGADDADEAEKKSTPKPSASPAKRKQGAEEDDEAPAKKSTPRKTEATPTPTPSATPSSTPSPESTATPQPQPPSSTPPAVAAPNEKKKGAPSSIPSSEIADYEKYPSGLRKLTDLGLDLAGRNLQYKYGSADPSNGGMDCSGFVHYVLNQTGLHDVPRDSSQQYVWARKAGTFRAVNSRADDSFELNELRPGDLLFWTGTYSIERDPPITHAMIYLGKEKGTGHRIMVGASDGRSYKGESRFGVSVFDFKIAHPPRDKDAKLTPSFIGYAHVPGLNDG